MSVEITDISCNVFRGLSAADLADDTVHRFIVGEDAQLLALSPEVAKTQLGDPFATFLLLAGTFPRTAGEVLEALKAADPALGDPMFFVLGDGSQIPFTPETADLNRNMRFLTSVGNGSEGADILISAFHPDETDVELMAWDRTHGGFNYYRTVGESTGWVFAGNSRHALVEPTEGKGPFQSHLSGALVMKELRSPWINWHSPDANILPSAFADDDPLRGHPWFTTKEPAGALTCETAVARPAIERWARFRFADIGDAGGAIENPERILRQVVTTPSVNLITSHNISADAPSAEAVEIPQTFFIDDSLATVAGLNPPPPFNVAGTIYEQSLATFDVTLTDGNGFAQTGDTHFAFCVPERAFEDQAILGQAVRAGLITPRLAACLLMTDFPNPVFSDRRAQMLPYVPPSAQIANGASSLSEDMANAIIAAAEGKHEDSPEREFAGRWQVGENFKEPFDAELATYFDAITQQLTTQEGFDAYYRLAEARRNIVRPMPIAESPLLFAATNIPDTPRTMRADGTVTEGS